MALNHADKETDYAWGISSPVYALCQYSYNRTENRYLPPTLHLIRNSHESKVIGLLRLGYFI